MKNKKKTKYEVGQVVISRGGYTCTIVKAKKGFFGDYYVCSWIVNDLEYATKYKRFGIKRNWQILGNI